MKGRVLIGALLVLIGAGLLLDRGNVWDFGQIAGTWWPLLLIALGAYQLVSAQARVGGTVLLAIGSVLLANNLEILQGAWTRYLWPSVLVLIGLWFLLSARRSRENANPMTRSVQEGALDQIAVFGGLELRPRIPALEKGDLTALFGGLELDLRDTTLAENGATLEATALFGGIEITVPEDWHVDVDGTPVFGGIETDLRHTAMHGPRLKIHGTAIFGAITVQDAPRPQASETSSTPPDEGDEAA